ncbi:MAG: hypothetical protein KDE55_20655 [Novosphingobium sp.]|nr:hypothetical protein [Novosphingobium sp.]
MSIPAGLRPWIGIAWKLMLFTGILVAAKLAGDWVTEKISMNLTPSTEPALHRAIMVAIVLYILLMMLPFVPGAEIGFALMTMLGPKIVPLVYACTVVALSLAFLVGRLIPQQTIIDAFDFLRMKRAAGLMRSLTRIEDDQRAEFLLSRSPSRFVSVLLHHRILALMVALNVPGNSVIGGGGGIGLFAGYSRLFTFPAFLIAVAIAVAPVPLFMMLAG